MASTSTSTSKLNRRRSKKSKFVPKPKPKQVWQVKQPTRNWLELPSDLMVNILQRVGVFDVLENAQRVCTAWRDICKDPAMWRVVYMDRMSGPTPWEKALCRKRCQMAVDRSQGQLLDLTIIDFCNEELLQYVAHRSSQLRRLEIIPYVREYGVLSDALKKLSSLEELSLVRTKVSKQDIEAVGRSCPLLQTLKVNQKAYSYWQDNDDDDEDDDAVITRNKMALAIGKFLPNLTHLELIGNSMDNVGLKAVLDGCCQLESLDLRMCYAVDLKGDLGERCSQQIKYLKGVHDSLEGCPHASYVSGASGYYFGYSDTEDEYNRYSDYGYDDEYEYSDYDDFTAYQYEDGLCEMMAFMDMLHDLES